MLGTIWHGALGMEDKKINELIQKKMIEESIRQDFEYTFSDRVDRYLEVKPHDIVPYTYFSAASTECSYLFRDGHFYGCIALTQAVAEALVRFMCKINFRRAGKVFGNNVEKLSNRGFISNVVKGHLLEIWTMRDDYHHLNPNVATDRHTLQELAREKTRLLVEVEKEVFRRTIVDGNINPENPKYWNINRNQAQVFLRIQP
jgi:hypothetical protein